VSAADDAPVLSIVVLSWNTAGLLEACLASLERCRDELPLQVVVVDNASGDGSADLVAERFGWCELVRNPRNEGYAIGNNVGAARARGEFLLFLNSDTEVPRGVLPALVGFLREHPGHGACAPRLDHPGGRVQLSCKRFPTRLVAVFYDTWFGRFFERNRVIPRYLMEDFDHATSRDVEQPPGAALVIRRALFEELGGFDPELWLFFNDVDLCRRLHALGHRVRYFAEVRVVHHEGKSTEQFPEFGAMWHKNRCAYYRKTFGWTGTLVARIMTTWRGLEEARRLRSAGAPDEERRRVWQAVREVWTS